MTSATATHRRHEAGIKRPNREVAGKATRPASRRGKILRRGLGVLFVLAFTELLSLAAIPVLNTWLSDRIRRNKDVFEEQSRAIRELLGPGQLIEIHPVMGWRYAPNYAKGPHRLNAAALRSGRDYDPVAPTGVRRVAAFGDSFVYGSEVGNADAWPRIIEAANPDLEVLNYGVPGYGTDQAYLRYREEGSAYRPRTVLIGFVPTDLSRTVNVYRRFFHSEELPLFKPRYVLDGKDGLALIECPAPTPAAYARLLDRPGDVLALGKNDQWYEPAVYESPLYDYSAFVRLLGLTVVKAKRLCDGDRLTRGRVFNEDCAAVKIQCKLFEEFAALVRGRGADPLVVLLPDKPTVQAVRRGEPPVYEPLVRHLKARGIDYVDAGDAFRAADVADADGWFATGGHYSPAGTRLVATWMTGILRERLSSPRPDEAPGGVSRSNP